MHPARTLKSATFDAHRDLERHPLVKKLGEAALDRFEYGLCLQGFERFHMGWELMISQHAMLRAPELPPPMAHAALIRADLDQLKPTLNRAAPVPLAFDWCATPGDIAGVLYVVEGSNLGNAVLAKRLKPLGYPLAFFTEAGRVAGTRWPRVQAWLNAELTQTQTLRRAVSSARNTFHLMMALFDRMAQPEQEIL
ncbi:biliverdin-producing heme oxygenase [Acanthopleuribacter pedis]|uniref:Biliverdin-producing heme oxygenase n=1 Tax=Acanthopleuribacter pedis TaxID=442870 RepID=A0A8J7QBF0_9BACT|nr:biliverdin-producing heme oxygenase [Acanthopleuribacter pedis]MBO1321009.1 biliverdin-producing heme oxygenase [Acanthopleuribacter pedis]